MTTPRALLPTPLLPRPAFNALRALHELTHTGVWADVRQVTARTPHSAKSAWGSLDLLAHHDLAQRSSEQPIYRITGRGRDWIGHHARAEAEIGPLRAALPEGTWLTAHVARALLRERGSVTDSALARKRLGGERAAVRKALAELVAAHVVESGPAAEGQGQTSYALLPGWRILLARVRLGVPTG